MIKEYDFIISFLKQELTVLLFFIPRGGERINKYSAFLYNFLNTKLYISLTVF